MSEMIERSDLVVERISRSGQDISFARAAWVSTYGEDADEQNEDRVKGLIGFLMRNQHASPFEHASITYRIHVPKFVAVQWMRHRTQSYNEESARYSVIQDEVYVPDVTSRPMLQVGSPGEYKYVPLVEGEYWPGDMGLKLYIRSVETAFWTYHQLLELGWAKEIARGVLPECRYTTFYATANFRNWLNFLVLRNDEHAQWEIRQCAVEIEADMWSMFPVAMEMWTDAGRPKL